MMDPDAMDSHFATVATQSQGDLYMIAEAGGLFLLVLGHRTSIMPGGENKTNLLYIVA